MYLSHFKLREFPFSLTSDPKFLFLSEDHARVKAYIEYAMKVQDSFLICTGEIGTGKTTLVNDALAQDHQDAVIAKIQINHLTSEEFLQQLMLEFALDPFSLHRIQILEKLKLYLQQQFRVNKKVFLIVDEAHNVSPEILDDIRYLSDFESDNNKLLGVILMGQPELNDLIDKPEMEHIAQRVRLRCHIKPLNPNIIADYIKHRLKVAGSRDISIFSEDSIPVIHQFTGGRIRLINTLCDYALLHCCVEKINKVTSMVIQKAANELRWDAYEKRFGEHSDVTRYILPTIPSNTSKIIVKRNGQLVDEVKLSSDCVSIGRQSDNDIPVDDFKVSRYHAQVVTQGNVSYLHDLNSTNGTLINDKKATIHKLTSGDIFSIGTYEFVYSQSVAPHSLDTGSVENTVIQNHNSREKKDITRQLTLEQRDQTRVLHKHPYINLVEQSVDS